MKDYIKDAIESARSKEAGLILPKGPVRRYSFETIHYILLKVLTELPDELTVQELREELNISENQY